MSILELEDVQLAEIGSALWRFSETLQGDSAKYLRSASRCIDKAIAALQRDPEGRHEHPRVGPDAT